VLAGGVHAVHALQNNRSPKIPKQMPIDDVKIIVIILKSGKSGKKVLL
jgi:hypothetical protein